MKRILVVDDEALILDSLRYSLIREGFDVSVAEDGKQALNKLQDFNPDIVVLDVMLPELDGFEVCRRIRESSTVPILMLTARSDEASRVAGLDMGADDYLVKPFSMRELLSRVNAMLRRVQYDNQEKEIYEIKIGRVLLDLKARQVFLNEEEIRLSAREFDLLAVLMQHAGEAVSRHALFDAVWGEGWIGAPHTLDVHIRWLRTKLERDSSNPDLIETVRGHGYRFNGA